MSSEQFTAKPPSSRPRCPACGAEILTAAAQRCWLCLEDLAALGVTMPVRLESHRPSESSADNVAVAVIGAFALVLIAVLCIEAPGLLVVLLVLATPALIRTVRQSSRRPDATGVTLVITFFSSLGVLTAVGMAAGAAFYATCFVICLGGLALTEFTSSGRRMGYEWILVPSVGGGLVVGIPIFVWLIRKIWFNPSRRGA